MLTVANGGTVNSTAPITIGDVTGASGVTVTGAGSVLNAFNSLSIGGTGCGCGPLLGTLTIADGGVVNSPGSTTITAGSTLNLGTGGLAGAIVTPAIANNGQIVANFTDTLTLGAAISGSGSLSKAGAGTLILTGNSTYSGGTTITGGTLQLGNGGASGSIAGNVTNNGTFAINRSDTFTFGGIISGSGAFQQNGAGTTIFTAANTYTGGTTINAGTLQLGSGGSLAPTGALTVNAGGTFNLNSFNQTVGDLSGMGAIALGSGTLTAGTANSTTFGGAVSGTGGLVKQGSGALTLSGASSYTGTTNINAGTLVVNGSLASNVFVNAGGTLRGTGSIGSLVVGNGAALSPGNSIGRLTVNGNLVMASAAAYIVEVSSAAADRTNVTGTASRPDISILALVPLGQLAQLLKRRGRTGAYGRASRRCSDVRATIGKRESQHCVPPHWGDRTLQRTFCASGEDVLGVCRSSYFLFSAGRAGVQKRRGWFLFTLTLLWHARQNIISKSVIAPPDRRRRVWRRMLASARR
jgi:autotransporter-associated beta strand protein